MAWSVPDNVSRNLMTFTQVKKAPGRWKFALSATICTAVAVLAVCMLAARGPALRWLAPFIAAGAMPLSIYTVHVIGVEITEALLPPLAGLAVHIVAALVFATVWVRFVSPRGPLEWPLSLLVARVRAGLLPTPPASRA